MMNVENRDAPASPSGRAWLTAESAAALLRVSVATVRLYATVGYKRPDRSTVIIATFPAVVDGRARMVFDAGDVDRVRQLRAMDTGRG